jgi:hypothetical protein
MKISGVKELAAKRDKLLAKRTDVNIDTTCLKMAEADTVKKYIKSTHPRVKRAYAVMLKLLEASERTSA